MNQNEWTQALRDYLEKQGDRAVDPAKAAQAIGCGQVKDLLEAARQLEQDGCLVFTKKGNLMSASAAGFCAARIVSQSLRFSFARPENGGADVFVPARKMQEAMLGDLVLLSHIQEEAKGPSGQVERVLKEGSHMVTGTVHKDQIGFVLKPDAAFRYELPIRRSKEFKFRDGEKVFVE